MAAASGTAVYSLPRFLLPRLSWTGPTTTSMPSALRAASTTFASIPQQQASPQRRRQSALFHTSRSSVPRCSVSNPHDVRSSVIICQNPSLRRSFHATAPRARDHYFDTLKFVQRLQSEGFTEDQSVAMMKVLNDVIEERLVIPSLPIPHHLSS
jgi:hypothetical protein